MYKPDEDIDRLSREAAEHYNAPGKPAWDALRQALDKELPQEKEKKRRGFLFFLVLALGLSLTGTVIWHGVQMNSSVASTDKPAAKKQEQAVNHTTVPENATRPVGAPNRTETLIPKSKDNIVANTQKTISGSNAPVAVTTTRPAGTPKNSNAAASLSGELAAKSVNTDDPLKNNAGSVKKPLVAGISNTNPSAGVALGRKQHITTGGNIGAPTGERIGSAGVGASREVKNKNTTGKAIQAGEDITADNAGAGGTTKDGALKGVAVEDTPGQIQTANVPDSMNNKSVASKDMQPAKPVATAKNKDSAKTGAVSVKNKSKKEKAILLGLTAGMDISTVKFTYGSNAGYNIGFMGGYQFSSQWSAYTGIIYTKKNYKLNGSDYNPPKHYWTQYVKVETIEGNCRMWELPLLARYTFNPAAKSTFFASAGMSSYFMKKQVYDYYYKTSTGPMNTVWTNDSSFNHIFTILDLSVGIEKRIGKHMNWQVEPYAKIPLGGVGFGNIRLSSFGVNLTVQYRQPIKR